MTNLVVGDRISSVEFAYGFPSIANLFNEEVKVISIDKEIGSPNASRSMASYVIEQITIEGGSERESIPDEQFIIARQLYASGFYNPRGELIAFFYQAGGHLNSVNEVTVISHMKRIFI